MYFNLVFKNLDLYNGIVFTIPNFFYYFFEKIFDKNVKTSYLKK